MRPFGIFYRSGVTGLGMWVCEIGADPAPGDEYGRNVRGSNQQKNAQRWESYTEANAALNKVREVHPNAILEDL